MFFITLKRFEKVGAATVKICAAASEQISLRKCAAASEDYARLINVLLK